MEGMKGERVCAGCHRKMIESNKPRDVQLPDEERHRIIKAAKARHCDTWLVEDKAMGAELEDTCGVQ